MRVYIENMDPRTHAKAQTPASPIGCAGEHCRAELGAWRPVIDRSRCTGRMDCARVCPNGVFAVERMVDEDFAELGVLGKIRAIMNGRMTAYTPRADACRACGLCLVACTEKAITLIM